jgi:hypothetical protein
MKHDRSTYCEAKPELYQNNIIGFTFDLMERKTYFICIPNANQLMHFREIITVMSLRTRCMYHEGRL